MAVFHKYYSDHYLILWYMAITYKQKFILVAHKNWQHLLEFTFANWEQILQDEIPKNIMGLKFLTLSHVSSHYIQNRKIWLLSLSIHFFFFKTSKFEWMLGNTRIEKVISVPIFLGGFSSARR